MKLKISLLAFLLSTIAFTQNKTRNNELTAPIVKTAKSSFDASEASRNGNVTVIIHRNINDKISGERYANVFAQGFASPQKTNNRPIYVTAFHSEFDGKAPTYVEFFMDGQKWDYKNQYVFRVGDAGRLLPAVMKDYVEKFGSEKILPSRMDKKKTN
jgi:hypothetical protein